MESWTLILTVSISRLTPGGGAATTIHHIPGFADKESCRQAADAWASNVSGYEMNKSAVCVRMGAKS